MVHRGQADVLVDPAVAGNVVGIEQFVVIGQVVALSIGRLSVANGSADIRLQHPADYHRRRVVRDVVEEAMPGADRIGQADGRHKVAFDQLGEVIGGAGNPVVTVADAHHHLRHATGAANEIAIGIGGQQRHVVHVGIRQVDPEDVPGLSLDHLPGGHAAVLAAAVIGGAEQAIVAQVAVGDQAPGGHWIAVGIERVFAQEHLVRRVRAVGLALIDEGRSGVELGIVGGTGDAVRASALHGPWQNHEIGRAARDKQRVIRLQRDKHHVRAALGHQVEAMVKELPEEGHPGVEAGGQAGVRRGVGDEEHRLVVSGAEHAIQAGAEHRGGSTVRRDGGRVAARLVGNQVTDHPWLPVHHVARSGIGRSILGIEQAQKRVVRSAVLALSGHQVVEAAIDRAQAERHLAVGQQVSEAGAIGVGFGDEDLLEDEFQVRLVEIGHFGFLDQSGTGTGRPKPSRTQVLADAIFWAISHGGTARPFPRLRTWNSRKTGGSPSDQAERIRTLGGPWKREVKVNRLHRPFTG